MCALFGCRHISGYIKLSLPEVSIDEFGSYDTADNVEMKQNIIENEQYSNDAEYGNILLLSFQFKGHFMKHNTL